MMQDVGKGATDIFRGWLMKWTNYIKGYQKRWFVLSNGLLSYYRNQAEVAHTCRGTINLATAFICTEDDPCSFVVSNGSTHYFHLKASSEVERQKWVTALELVKAKAIKMLESDDEDDDDKNESCTKPLSSKVDDLQTCNDLVAKHGTALQKAISEVQDLSEFRDEEDELARRLKVVNEKATLFRITSSAMISACGEFLELAQKQEKNFQKVVDHERAQRIRLEQTVEDLAKQHNFLEEVCREQVVPKLKASAVESSQASNMTAGDPSIQENMDTSHDSSDDEDAFFDAEELVVNIPPADISPSSSEVSVVTEKDVGSSSSSHKRSASDFGVSQPAKPSSGRHPLSASDGDLGNSISAIVSEVPPDDDYSDKEEVKKISRRKNIPPKPTQSLSLWNILKNCIGKDLSKIPMPVNFNEPLSMLQRLTEEMEYSDLLDKAAAATNSLEEMCYVAAFTISAYSTTSIRTGKPFNPLLGETFEMDRSLEEGWRCLAEQVCHHPPISCFHIEHTNWTYWQDFTATSKFRGNYLQIVPLGVAHLTFRTSGNHYTWRKVTTTVRNIIVGKLWVDQSGEMDIVNHTTGDTCKLKYNAYTYFSRETPRKVTGYVLDKSKVTHYVLTGTWDNKIDCAEVVYTTKSEGGQPKQVAQTRTPVALWKMNVVPEDREPQYNFSHFAMSLNEPDDLVAISDSRFRPDQRLMELGKWDDANTAKGKLEEKQRAKRREREAEAELAKREGRVYEAYKPVWFEKVYDEMSDLEIHVYKGGYWEAKEKQDWSMCPDIF